MSPVIWAALGWIVAAFLGGMWWGERGRRLTAENWIMSGTPNAPEAVSDVPSERAEDRLRESNERVSDETVERAVKGWMAEAKEAGVDINEDDLRRDARQMFAGENVEGGP